MRHRWFLVPLVVATMGLSAAYAAIAANDLNKAWLGVMVGGLISILLIPYYYSWRNRGYYGTVEPLKRSDIFWYLISVAPFAIVSTAAFAFFMALIALFTLKYARIGEFEAVKPMGLALIIAGLLALPLIGILVMLFLAAIEYSRAGAYISGSARAFMRGLGLAFMIAVPFQLVGIGIAASDSIAFPELKTILGPLSSIMLTQNQAVIDRFLIGIVLVYALAALEEVVFRPMMHRIGDYANGIFVMMHVPTRAAYGAMIAAATGNIFLGIFLPLLVIGVIGFTTHSLLRASYLVGGLLASTITHALYNAVLTIGDFFTAIFAIFLGALLYGVASAKTQKLIP